MRKTLLNTSKLSFLFLTFVFSSSIAFANDWSKEELDKTKSHAEEIGTAAAILLHDGETVFSYGDLSRKYRCHSIRKALLNSLYGIYSDRGEIDLDATLGELGIDEKKTPLTVVEKSATIRQLLCSQSGIYIPAAAEAPSMKKIRPRREEYKPGEFTYYNNWDFNALGSIFRQETGKDIFKAFHKEVAKPIGMQDFKPRHGSYRFDRRLSEHPAYPFKMSTRDLARYGMLFLNEGNWEGKQILPKKWVQDSVKDYSPPGSRRNRGYLWQIYDGNSELGKVYYHNGYNGHQLLVIPQQRIVFVHRANTDAGESVKFHGIQSLLHKLLSSNSTIKPLLLPYQSFRNKMERLTQSIDELRQEHSVPGLSLAMSSKGRVLRATGLGYADLENQLPATRDTPYHIASLSKPFASALTMNLVAEGKLDLDSHPSLLLDKPFKFMNGQYTDYEDFCRKVNDLKTNPQSPRKIKNYLRDFDPSNSNLTLRHFLSHTANGHPGSAYKYSGVFFNIVTPTLESIYGTKYPEILASRITSVLEMTHTFPQLESGRNEQILAARARPYRIDANGSLIPSNYPKGLSASAGMVSTVLDLAKFDTALEAGKIIPKELLVVSQTPGISNDGKKLPYGLGWFSQKYRGYNIVWHYGWQPNSYSSLYIKIPQLQFTMIILANSDGLSAPFSLGEGDVTRSPFAQAFLDTTFAIIDFRL